MVDTDSRCIALWTEPTYADGIEQLKRLLLEAGCFGKIKRIECHLPSVDEWDDLAFEWMEKGRRKRENSSGNRTSRSQKRKRKESL